MTGVRSGAVGDLGWFATLTRGARSTAVRHGRSPGASSAASAQEALRFARSLTRACALALDHVVAGVILHGSLTLGDYIPGRSDVDVLIVIDDPLTDGQLRALIQAAESERPQAPCGVDLRVATREAAAAATRAPPMEAYIEIVPGRESMHVDTRQVGERDLVIEFSICRAHGRALYGAAPADLIGPVPKERVLDVGDVQLADWESIGNDPRNAQLTVLTACRIWRFAEEGRHCSKSAAGEWALRRDPTLQAVRDALHQRRSDPTKPIDWRQVRRLLAVVRARLAEGRNNA